MASQTEIVNHALTKLGEYRIQNLQDGSKAANEASAVWDQTLEAELAANTWAFATRRASIAASATPPTWGYLYAYPVPADFLVLTYIDGQDIRDISDYRSNSSPLFTVEGRSILTDTVGPLKIQYVARIDDPDLWDPSFRYAFACKLAQILCYALTPARSDKEANLQREYMQAIATARQRSAIQTPPQIIQDSSWIAERMS